MTLPTIRRTPPRAWQGDGFALVEIPRDDHRVHVRLATDRWRVAELRRHEAHCERHIPLRLRRTLRRPKLGEHRRGAQRSSPRAKILRAVAADALLQIRVDVARRDDVPAFVAAISEQLRARRTELTSHELHELRIGHD